MHLIFFFLVGVAIADDPRLRELEICVATSLRYLGNAKQDIDGTYKGDMWHPKFLENEKRCVALRTSIIKDGAERVPCRVQEDHSFKCEAVRAGAR